jgi:hypothetical protein
VDVERTNEFILQSQAKAELRMQRFEEDLKKAEARSDAMEKRLDKRINGITKLLEQGTHMMVRIETKFAELAEAQKELAEAQKKTDRTVNAFIRSLRNGWHGR